MSLNHILKADWYAQGFPAIPIYLNLTCSSGIHFPKEKPYAHFLLHYSQGYGEGCYDPKELDRLYKLNKNKDLKKAKEKCLQDWKKSTQGLNQKIKKINTLTDQELIKTLNQASLAQVYSCGTSHYYIEPISMGIEKDFKNELLKHLGPRPKFNEYYSQLTTPSKQSWVAQEELDLQKIKNPEYLPKHLKKYFWIKNSYNEAKTLNLKTLTYRWNKIKKEKLDYNLPNKKSLIKKLKLTPKLKKQIKTIDFVTIWQDERKADIFKAIDYLDKVLTEISKRTKVEKKHLYYLSATEALNSKTLKKITSLKTELIKREKGCFFYITPKQEKVYSGAEYKKMLHLKEKINKEKIEIKDSLHGSVANVGTAMGRVIICKNISHISKVQKGDVLVSSMTRPEFMPAMKKAAAIITDEGGITCHAAIVSRELGKPCIIGTKVATKVLKDGMLVEVKANHGIVKIIKQSYTS